MKNHVIPSLFTHALSGYQKNYISRRIKMSFDA